MVEIIPKEAPPIPRWLNILFYLVFVLLVSSIVSYFVLDNSLRKAQASLIETKENLLKEETPENLALEREILNYERKLEDLSQLVPKHLTSSKVFSLIEENCHPQVWFISFNLDPGTREATLSGRTRTFENLGQQLLILQAESMIRSASLKRVFIDKEGEINFELSLSLDEGILK